MPFQESRLIPDWLGKEIELFRAAIGLEIFFAAHEIPKTSCQCAMAHLDARLFYLDSSDEPGLQLLWLPVETNDLLFGLLYTEPVLPEAGLTSRCACGDGSDLKSLFGAGRGGGLQTVSAEKLKGLGWLLKLLAQDLARRFQADLHLNEPSAPFETLVRRAEAILHDEYRDSISTRDVAARLKVSESHLCHAFQATKGTTLLHCLNDLRLQEARRLLIEYPRLSVAEVAFASGFQSLSRFNEQFRRRQLISPGKWRRAQM